MKKIILFCTAIVWATLSLSAKPQATPTDTVNVVCYDLQLNTDFIGAWGMTYIFANNSEYKLTGAIFADSIPPGTYTDCVMDLVHIETNTQIPAKSVTLELSVDEKKMCAIKGTMLGENNVLYNLDLSWTVPTPTDTVHIAFDNSAWVAYYPDLNHDFKLSNQDEQYDIALDIVGVPLGESFTEKNLNIGYCLIADKATLDTVKIAAAEGKVWQSNDTTYMTAKVIGFDAVLYDMELWYAVPTPKETVVLNFANATFYNKLEEEGFYALIGKNEDESLEFAISLLGATEEDVPGIYTNDGVFGEFTGKNYDFINYIGGESTTYIAKWNETKNDYDLYPIEKGQAKVTMDEDENVTLIGSFVARDGVQYEITLTTKVDIPRFDDDMTEGSIDCVVTGNDITLEDYTEEKGSIFFDVMTDKELMALYFYAEESDPDIVIPEGTYYIDETQDYYTVNASDGTISTYPSFYATHNGFGFTSMYFFVSGTVEVSKKQGKLYMEINAQNSYGVPAHIIYDGSLTTDVENVSAEHSVSSQKKMVNGQLMIIRNGKTYNAQGACIE